MSKLIFAALSLAFSAIVLAPAHAQSGDIRASMTDVQRNALKDGCWKRYSGNDRKRQACLNGEAFWEDALRDGCHQRYSGNGSKLSRCLNTGNLGGQHYGGSQKNHQNGYYGNDGYNDGYNTSRDDGYYSDRRHDNRNGYGNNNSNNGSGYYGGNTSSGSSGSSSLSDVQQNALKDGCWQRYSGNDRKRQACLNGQAYWRDALRDGCWKRYNGNQGKLDRCLSY